MVTREECQKIIDACLIFKDIVASVERKENTSKKILGVLGEYYVLRELLVNGYSDLLHKGGHSGYDIEIQNPQTKIEVKTSTLKNDPRIFKGRINTWGWTVETKTQHEKAKNTTKKRFDFLVTVALDTSWKNPEFFIFTYDETVNNSALEYPDNKKPIHSSIKKRIQLFQKENFNEARSIENEVDNKYDVIFPLDMDLIFKDIEYHNNWNKLRS